MYIIKVLSVYRYCSLLRKALQFLKNRILSPSLFFFVAPDDANTRQLHEEARLDMKSLRNTSNDALNDGRAFRTLRCPGARNPVQGLKEGSTVWHRSRRRSQICKMWRLVFCQVKLRCSFCCSAVGFRRGWQVWRKKLKQKAMVRWPMGRLLLRDEFFVPT